MLLCQVSQITQSGLCLKNVYTFFCTSLSSKKKQTHQKVIFLAWENVSRSVGQKMSFFEKRQSFFVVLLQICLLQKP